MTPPPPRAYFEGLGEVRRACTSEGSVTRNVLFSLAELSYDMQKITKIFLNKLDLPQSD